MARRRARCVIVGGGNLDGTGISEKFIELAGGPDKKFVIVPTAGGNRNAQDGDRAEYKEEDVVALVGARAASRTSGCCTPTIRRSPTPRRS